MHDEPTTPPDVPDGPSSPASLVAYLIFPVVLGVGLACTWWFSQRVDNPILVAIVVSVSAIVVIAGLERVFPHRREWGESRGDVITDVWHTLLHQVLLSRGLNVMWTLALAGATAWLTTRVDGGLWPHQWPILAQLLAMLLIAEFGRYWPHRLSAWGH